MPRLRIHLNGAEIKTIELNAAETYVAGRAAGSEILLEDHPGVSRQHFRVSMIEGRWTVQTMSKFGDVQFNGEPAVEIALEPGSFFRVPPYDFHFFDDSAPQDALGEAGPAPDGAPRSDRNALALYTGGGAGTGDEFNGNEEKTAIGRLEMVPYVKITGKSADDTFRLEGNLWVAGREDSCEIPLNDLKASRRQFELASAPKGYFITDLGSSNGTLLNGSPLAPNEPSPVRSGDVISVGGLTINFELRDPKFKSKLAVISQNALQSQPLMLAQASGGETAFPPYGAEGPGGVVPLDPGAPPMGWPGPYDDGGYAPPSPKKGLDFSQPKTRLLLVIALAFLGYALFGPSGGGDGGKGPDGSVSADPKTLAFQRLTDPQKKFVKDTYELAYTLFMQQKFDLAMGQLQKIHDILPEGYDESYKIAEDVQQIKKDQEALIAIKLERERVEQNKKLVAETVSRCRETANRATSIDEIQGCIAEAITIDPENEDLRSLVAHVQAKIEAQRVRQEQRANYAGLVARRGALYNNAVKMDGKGDPFAAIAAYKKVVDSSLPDPDGLGAKARARIAELKAGIDQQVEKGLADAQRLFDADKLRDARDAIERVNSVDPGNPKTAELGGRIIKELNNRMKAIYEDSVLEEGLGNVESAKEKWRKIMEIDHPKGEYYRRAKSKLRQYGGV